MLKWDGFLKVWVSGWIWSVSPEQEDKGLLHKAGLGVWLRPAVPVGGKRGLEPQS